MCGKESDLAYGEFVSVLEYVAQTAGKIMLLGHQAACITERRTALLPAL